MSDLTDGVIIGLLIGVLVGIPIGWMVAQTVSKGSMASSVIFERDKEGRIAGLHYVPTGAK